MMKIEISRGTIKLRKEMNELDKLVIDFTNHLDRKRIKYVLVSGYVSILFGRSRASEDIDLIVSKISKQKFSALWKDLWKHFECITTDKPESAYKNYLMSRTALRFSRKGMYIPNIEFKFPKIELDNWVLDNSKKILLNNKILKISPIELQIPYKLFLASEKDIEDARHLYKLFNKKMNQNLFEYFLEKLDKQDAFHKYIV